MKWYSIYMATLTIILLLSVIPLGAYRTQLTGSKDENANETSRLKTAPKNKPQNDTPTVMQQQATHGETGEQECHGQTAKSSNDPSGWTEYVNAFSTLAIAIFTILLFFAVVWQTRTTRSLERAWITANLDWFEKGRLRIANNDSTETGESVAITLKLTCKNRGRSLARIENILGRMDLGSKAIRGRPNESSLFQIGEMDAIQADSESFAGVHFTCEGKHTQGLSLFVYVLIKYRDIFGKDRETSLGYVVSDAQNVYRQTAIPERNTNTSRVN
jgi:hypothetical protein